MANLTALARTHLVHGSFAVLLACTGCSSDTPQAHDGQVDGTVDGTTTDANRRTLCGQPAVGCDESEECIAGECLPRCSSGIRCVGGISGCCDEGQVCLANACVQPHGTCEDNVECEAGEFCEPILAQCLPQPDDIGCEVQPEFVTFEPSVEWHWSGYSENPAFHNVAVTPAVADIDADGIPEVVVAAYRSGSAVNAMLVVLDGVTGTEELTIPHTTLNLAKWTGAALGNLDADPELEIVIIARGRGVVVLEHTGAEKWSSDEGSLASFGSTSNAAKPQPAIADFDADGSPEVFVGGVILSASGTVLLDKGMIGGSKDGTGSWYASTAADIDEDGQLELIGGNVVYELDGEVLWHNVEQKDGFTGVGDIDRDGHADVVAVGDGTVRVLDGITGNAIFGPIAIPGGGSGGAPTIGDFDGDGRPEFSTAGKGAYTVYDPDCVAGADKTFCPSERTDQILWSTATQDISSSVTGSSLFDFEGDGTVEVVYNDECHLYVYDGRTGAELMKINNSSRTAAEYPLVVDVDADGNSEFVVPANNDQISRDKCDPPGTQGVFAFGDASDRWVRTRPVWNQHSYHVTNVTAGGNIPKVESRNWDQPGLNNFRQNSQGEGIFNAPDLTPLGLTANTLDCPNIVLNARITNVGALGIRRDLPVSFYRGTPTGDSTLLGTVKTTTDLMPGGSEVLSQPFTLPDEGAGSHDFFVVVDDDGTGSGIVSECREDNNVAQLAGVGCTVLH